MIYRISCRECGILGTAGLEQNAMRMASNHTQSYQPHMCVIKDNQGKVVAEVKANMATHMATREGWQ